MLCGYSAEFALDDTYSIHCVLTVNLRHVYLQLLTVNIAGSCKSFPQMAVQFLLSIAVYITHVRE